MLAWKFYLRFLTPFSPSSFRTFLLFKSLTVLSLKKTVSTVCGVHTVAHIRRFELKKTHWDSRHARQTSWTQKMARSPRVMNVFNLIYTTFIIIKVYIGTMHYIIDRWLLESYLSIRQSYAINSNGYVGDLEWFKLKIWIKSFWFWTPEHIERIQAEDGEKVEIFKAEKCSFWQKRNKKWVYFVWRKMNLGSAQLGKVKGKSKKRSRSLQVRLNRSDTMNTAEWNQLTEFNWSNVIGGEQPLQWLECLGERSESDRTARTEW